jgi:hypothetical protein
MVSVDLFKEEKGWHFAFHLVEETCARPAPPAAESVVGHGENRGNLRHPRATFPVSG